MNIAMGFIYPCPVTTFVTTVDSVLIGDTVTLHTNVDSTTPSYRIIWKKNGVPFDTTYNTDSFSYVKGTGIDTITAYVTDYFCSSTSNNSAVVYAKNSIPNTVTHEVLKGVNIYPNPVTDMLHINATSPQQYILRSITGSVLLNGTINNGSNLIDTHALPAGIYLLEMTDSTGQRQTIRVVKE
jgi:Secretion system C-terminal sorting domain